MPARFASARFTAAGLALALLAVPLGERAFGGDLYGEDYGPPPDAGPPPAGYPYAERGPPDAYDEPDAWAEADRGPGGPDAPDAYPYRGSLKDGYAEPAPPPPPPPYGYRERAERYAGGDYGPGCVPPAHIRARLAGEGWTEFRLVRQGPNLVMLRARRVESGRVFILRLESCRGTIIDARPYVLRTFGVVQPYRRWVYRGRPY